MVDSTFQQKHKDLKMYLSLAVFAAGLAVSGIGLFAHRTAQILDDSAGETASWVLIGLGAVITIATFVVSVVMGITSRKAQKAEELEAAGRRARGELTLDEFMDLIRGQVVGGVSLLKIGAAESDEIKVMVRTGIERSNDDVVSVRYRSFSSGSVVRTQDDDRDDSAEAESDVPLPTDDGRDS